MKGLCLVMDQMLITIVFSTKPQVVLKFVKDVTFDESNGSKEQIDPSFVEKEDLPCEAMKKLALGEVKPQERKEHEEEGGTRWICEIPAQSPKVLEKVWEVLDMSESSR